MIINLGTGHYLWKGGGEDRGLKGILEWLEERGGLFY